MDTYEHAVIVRSANGTGIQAHGAANFHGQVLGTVQDIVTHLTQEQQFGWQLVAVHTGPDGEERYWLRREAPSQS